MGTVEERLVLACLYLGVNASVAKDAKDAKDAKEVKVLDVDLLNVNDGSHEEGAVIFNDKYAHGCDIKYQEILKKTTQKWEGENRQPASGSGDVATATPKTLAEKHADLLRNAFSAVSMLPIESPEMFLSWSGMETLCAAVKTCGSAEQLQQKAIAFDRQSVLHEQLKASLEKCLKQLKRAIGKLQANSKKKEAAEKTERESIAKKALEEKAAKAQTTMSFAAQVAPFHLDWKTLQHSEFKCISPDNAFSKLGKEDLKIPFKLGAPCENIKAICKHLQPTMAHWLTEESGIPSALSSETDAVQAQMEAKDMSPTLVQNAEYYMKGSVK